MFNDKKIFLELQGTKDAKLTRLIVLLLVVVLLLIADAASFSTVIYPEPDYDVRAVIMLPEEENATVTFQCVAYQDNALRVTFWFVQRYGDSEQQDIPLNSTQFDRSGTERENLTVAIITQDLDRAEIWWGPSNNQREPRFILGFEGD